MSFRSTEPPIESSYVKLQLKIDSIKLYLGL